LPEGIERVALKSVHLNRCPVVATAKLLDVATAERLGIDLTACERHWAVLKDAELGDKIRDIFATEDDHEPRDAEEALYQGFLPSGDKPLLARVRRAAPAELAVLQSQFSDSRYREMLFRYRARYYPDTLTEEENDIWEEYRYQALTEPSEKRLNLDAYFDRLQELETEPDQSRRNLDIIAALKEWGDLILEG
jgi:exodeoxyribonuclease I